MQILNFKILWCLLWHNFIKHYYLMLNNQCFIEIKWFIKIYNWSSLELFNRQYLNSNEIRMNTKIDNMNEIRNTKTMKIVDKLLLSSISRSFSWDLSLNNSSGQSEGLHRQVMFVILSQPSYTSNSSLLVNSEYFFTCIEQFFRSKELWRLDK